MQPMFPNIRLIAMFFAYARNDRTDEPARATTCEPQFAWAGGFLRRRHNEKCNAR